MDLTHLHGGEAWLDAIERHVTESFVMVALIGPDWLNLKDQQGALRLSQQSDPVRFEIATALRRKVPVIPVLLDDAKLPNEQELPLEMRGMLAWQAMPLRFKSFDEDAAAIADAIRKYIPVKKAPRWAVAACTIFGVVIGCGAGFGGAAWMMRDAVEVVRRAELAESKVRSLETDLAAAGASTGNKPQQAEFAKLQAENKRLRQDVDDARAAIGREKQARAELETARSEIAALRNGHAPAIPATGSSVHETLRAMQQKLHAQGYYNGAFDGVPGPKFWGAMRVAYVDQGSMIGGVASQDTDKFRELVNRATRDPTGGQAALTAFAATLIEKRAVPTADPAQRPGYDALVVEYMDREVRRDGSFPFDGDQAEFRLNVKGPAFDRFVVLDNGLSIYKVELCKRPCTDVPDTSRDKKYLSRDDPKFVDSGKKFSFITNDGQLLSRTKTSTSDPIGEFNETLWLRLTHHKAMSKSFSVTLVYRRE